MPSRSYEYNGYGPDMDSEFTFGPRSIYVEHTQDEVSEFTDFATIRTDDFDPVGVYRKADPVPHTPRRVTPPRPPPERTPSYSSSRRSASRREDIDEEYRDEYDGDDDRFAGCPRVAEWYSTMERANEEEQSKRSLVSVGFGAPNQSRDGMQSDRDKRLAKILFRMILACICLFLISGAAAFAFAYFYSDILPWGNDEGDAKDADISEAAPTTAPTTATTTDSLPTLPLTLVQTFNGPSNYGQSVDLEGNFLVVGAPALEGGIVNTFFNSDNSWRFVPEINGEPGDFLGVSVDIVKSASGELFLLAGSMGANTEGKATLYRFDIPRNEWVAQGTHIEGKLQVSGTPEKFGSSVALSDNLRAVVGAPDNDLQGNQAGRVYIFEYDLAEGETYFQALPMTSQTFVGSEPESQFGNDVAITQDGNFIAVAEPGVSSFSVYGYINDVWDVVFQDQIIDEADFGSSVQFLSDNCLAVGSPLFDGGKGAIRLYLKSPTDDLKWEMLPPLVGENLGDGFGEPNTVGGRFTESGPEVVVGTAKGTTQRFDLINRSWVKRFSVDRNSPVTAIATESTDSKYSVFTGFRSDQQALLYSSDPTEYPIEQQTTVSPTTTLPSNLEWRLTAGPFTTTGQIPDTRYGHAVALAGDFLAVGEPRGNAADLGDVAIYDRSGNWKSAEVGFALDTEEFGFALDASVVNGKPSMIVGAKETRQESLSASFGSAHYYELGDNGWAAVGDPLLPALLPPESGGEFGGSVAMATDVRRVAIGAPMSSIDLTVMNSGRVYTFEYDGSSWLSKGAPLVGGTAGQLLGSSVAMSKDGNYMAIGSSGHNSGDGGAYFHEWKDDAWHLIFPLGGTPGTRETLGTSVAILSDDGKTVAFGAPGYGENEGKVKVYQELFPGFYRDLEEIVGNSGERVGSTIAGMNNRLAVGTDTGSFRVYELSGISWSEIATGPTDLGSKVISIDMTNGGNTVAVGLESQEVFVYELS